MSNITGISSSDKTSEAINIYVILCVNILSDYFQKISL